MDNGSKKLNVLPGLVIAAILIGVAALAAAVVAVVRVGDSNGSVATSMSNDQMHTMSDGTSMPNDQMGTGTVDTNAMHTTTDGTHTMSNGSSMHDSMMGN